MAPEDLCIFPLVIANCTKTEVQRGRSESACVKGKRGRVKVEERRFSAALRRLGTGFSPGGASPEHADETTMPDLRPGMVV